MFNKKEDDQQNNDEFIKISPKSMIKSKLSRLLIVSVVSTRWITLSLYIILPADNFFAFIKYYS
jgi:hypothetical protein